MAAAVFVLMRLVPGDPVAMMAGPGASAEDIARLRTLNGLDRGIAEQFALWLKALLQADLGESMSTGHPVGALIAAHLPATLELALLVLPPACAGALAAALVLAHFRARWVRGAVESTLGLMQGIPDFLWGMLLMLALGVWLPLFPLTGRSDPQRVFDFATPFHLVESSLRGELVIAMDLLRHMALPALALALPFAAVLTRGLTTALRTEADQDYVLFARAQGLSRFTALRRVALRNALIPALALGGTQLTLLLGGTVLVEHIFAYPGIGRLAVSAVTQRDLPLIQGIVLTFALLFVTTQLLVDCLCLRLDPRLRMSE